MTWYKRKKYVTIRQPVRSRIPPGMWVSCPGCQAMVLRKDWSNNLSVCPKCGHHDRMTARERIGHLIDSGTFEEHDTHLVSTDPLNFVDLKPYPERIRKAREKTGEREAVISGLGKMEGRRVSIAVMDFNFNGGSMGSVVGEKIARSMERGIQHGLPVINICASGGARMQEGILSLMQMAKTSAVAARLGQAGLPYLVVHTHPTTAGVMASFASLGDVILAEPDALVGFAGPRVIEQTIKQVLPQGFQRSEFVQEHGFIDMVVNRQELKTTLARLMNLLKPVARSKSEEPGDREFTNDSDNAEVISMDR